MSQLEPRHRDRESAVEDPLEMLSSRRWQYVNEWGNRRRPSYLSHHPL